MKFVRSPRMDTRVDWRCRYEGFEPIIGSDMSGQPPKGSGSLGRSTYGPPSSARIPRWIAFALLLSGPVMTGLSFALLMIPHESTGCLPAAEGGEICWATIGPGPLAPVAGVLFLAGLAVPGVGLIALAAHAGRPGESVAFLAGGVALVTVVFAITALYLLVGTV